MSDTPMKTYYMGKDIEQMSRQELIEALQSIVKMLGWYQAPERSRAFALGSVEMLKRGERQCSTQ